MHTPSSSKSWVGGGGFLKSVRGLMYCISSKTCVKQPLSKRQKMVLKTNYHLKQVKNIAECSKGSILQYF